MSLATESLSTFHRFQTELKKDIEKTLDQVLPQKTDRLLPNLPALSLYEAMRYAVLGGGKRLRPLLVYAIGLMLEVPKDRLQAPAAAVELIHCFSLVHDDLPAMDNDDLRRGKPTCHKQFDEATAILVGDALLALAFEVLSSPTWNPIQPELALKMIRTLSYVTGSEGLILGQALDMAAPKRASPMTYSDLTFLHQKKTGDLFSASVALGALAGNAEESLLLELNHFSALLGLGFQIQDDILGVTQTTSVLGKPQGSDRENGKITYPDLIGLQASQQKVQEILAEIADLLNSLPYNTQFLAALTKDCLERSF